MRRSLVHALSLGRCLAAGGPGAVVQQAGGSMARAAAAGVEGGVAGGLRPRGSPSACGRGFASEGFNPDGTPFADASRAGTADLCDVHVPDPVDKTLERAVQIAKPGLFRDFGGRTSFSGPASTVLCYENNPLVRKALEEPGRGRVLVVDAGGSMRCAVLGDNLAENAQKNGWSGIIVHGCIRDSETIAKFAGLGVKALATHPLKSSKRDPGLRDVPVAFAGVTVKPGDWVYADADGILVAPHELKL